MKKFSKRTLAIFLALIITLTSLPIYTFALDEDMLSYELTDDGKGIKITECFSLAEGDVTIPSKINGKPVVEIGEAAFATCADLTSIVLPDTIVTIGDLAFASCDGLELIVIGESAVNLGEDIFYGHTNKLNVRCAEGSAIYNYCVANGVPIEGEVSGLNIQITSALPVVSGNTITFKIKSSANVTKLRMEDGSYIVEEWTSSSFYTDKDNVRTWTISQIINTIGENRRLSFRAGNASGYENSVYLTPAFTCIENEKKLSATNIKTPSESDPFVQGDMIHLTWTVDGVPGDGQMPDYFTINMFKDKELIFAERKFPAAGNINDEGIFYYRLDGSYFEEIGEYEINVTSVKEGWQFSEDILVININQRFLAATVISFPGKNAQIYENETGYVHWNVGDVTPESADHPDSFTITVTNPSGSKTEYIKAFSDWSNGYGYDYDEGFFYFEIPGEVFAKYGDYSIAVTSTKEGYLHSSDSAKLKVLCPHETTRIDPVYDKYPTYLNNRYHVLFRTDKTVCVKCNAVLDEIRRNDGGKEHVLFEGILCECGYYVENDNFTVIENCTLADGVTNPTLYWDAGKTPDPDSKVFAGEFFSVVDEVDGYYLIKYEISSTPGTYKARFIEKNLVESKLKIIVQAQRKSGGFESVSDAIVEVKLSNKIIWTSKTDKNGVVAISLDNIRSANSYLSKFSDFELQDYLEKNAFISAYKDIVSGYGQTGDARYELFKNWEKNSAGDPIRYIYQLHATRITKDDVWLGYNLGDVINSNSLLTLTEPRLLVNLAVCYYFPVNKVIDEDSYRKTVKNALKELSNTMASSTDGHVILNRFLLFKTDNRADFYDLNSNACKADIRIATFLPLGDKVSITNPNAFTGGYFSDRIINRNEMSKGNEFETYFIDLPRKEKTAMKSSFAFAMLPAKWNESSIIASNTFVNGTSWASFSTHELGHYILGLGDEYDTNLGHYGIMDDKHDINIELSNSYDYNRWYYNLPPHKQNLPEHRTSQLEAWGHSCEWHLKMLLEGKIDAGNNDWVKYKLDLGDYVATYTEASTTNPTTHRRIRTNNNYGISPTIIDLTPSVKNGTISTSSIDELMSAEETNIMLVDSVNFTNINNVVIKARTDSAYSLYSRISGEDYALVCEAEKGESKNIDISDFESNLVELVIVSDGKKNTINLDKISVDNGAYLFNSLTNQVISYISSDGKVDATFVSSDTIVSLNDYFSINQMLNVVTDSDGSFIGEVYSIVPTSQKIDYSTVSWFVNKKGVWTKLDTTFKINEHNQLGAVCSMIGDGQYVLMAEPAKETVYSSPKDLVVTTDGSVYDGVVFLSFSNSDDENISYYEVYYSDKPFDNNDIQNGTVSSKIIGSESKECSVFVEESDKEYYFGVVAIGNDGGRSELSELTKCSVDSKDTNKDGIPDWWASELGFSSDEEIAAGDDDGDGYTTLEEYNNGTNPFVPELVQKPNEFFVKWIIDGEVTEATLKEGDAIIPPADPVKDGYKFVGWTPAVPETMPAYDMTFTAVFEKSYICPVCGNEILGEEAISEHKASESRAKATVKIKNNTGSNTINFGETLELTAETENKPADAFVVWYVDGTKAGEGEKFSISFESGTKNVEVKLVDASGNVLKDSNGNEIKDTEKVSVNAGIWQKIVSFFKNLFRMNRTVIQAFYKTF